MKTPEEPIYKEYLYPNGEILRSTKSEFDKVVSVFERLLKQDEKMRREGRQLPSKASTNATPSSPPPTSHVTVPQETPMVALKVGGLHMAEMRDIGDRLTDFSAGIIKLLHQLPSSSVSKKIEDQMVRSAMSSGANYEEARGADSRADFCNKLDRAEGDA